MDKKKILVPKDMTMGSFVGVIRKRILINSDQALFLFVNQKLPAPATTLQEVYARNKDEEGFLYVVYSLENTFGSALGVERPA